MEWSAASVWFDEQGKETDGFYCALLQCALCWFERRVLHRPAPKQTCP